MKLYTEEEIVNFLKKEFADEIDAETFMENLTPVELPSDDDAKNYLGDTGYVPLEYMDGFFSAIQWVRDRIKGGKKC